jgi:hypothetical protein
MGLVSVEVILRWLHSLSMHVGCPASGSGRRLQWKRQQVRMETQGQGIQFQFRQSA